MNNTKQITSISVYWDNRNEGWAYRAEFNNDIDCRDEGCIDGVASDDLDNAIAEACRLLGVDIAADQFAREPSKEGGYAAWVSG